MKRRRLYDQRAFEAIDVLNFVNDEKMADIDIVSITFDQNLMWYQIFYYLK